MPRFRYLKVMPLIAACIGTLAAQQPPPGGAVRPEAERSTRSHRWR